MGNRLSDVEADVRIPNVLELLGIFLERIWLILGITLTAVTIGIVIAYVVPNQYWTRSLLLIVEPEKELYMNAQEYKDLMILPKRSSEFYNTQIELIQGYAYIRKLTDRLGLKFSEDLLRKLRKSLRVNRLSGTQLVQISMTFSDPVLAAKIVNNLAEIYVEQYKADILSITKEFVSMILKGQGKPLDDHSKKLLENILGSVKDSSVGVLQARRDEVAKRLDELTIYYKEEHPDVLALKAKVADLDQQIDAEVRRVVESWQESLKSQNMMDKIRIVEYANVPTKPIVSTKLRVVLMALGVGLGGGCALVFLLYQFDPRIKSEDELINEAGLVCLGTVPLKVPHGSLEKFSKLPADLKDAFAYLRTAIQFSTSTERSHVMLVTSALAREGKSSIASNLAISFATGGLRTVLVDANLRKPVLQNLFHVPGAPGLADILISKADSGSALLTTDIPGLSVMPAGENALNPAEILNSARMIGLIGELRQRFDKVIIDAPAILGTADSVVLASIADSIALVVNTGVTDKRLLKKAIEELRLGQMEGKILGGILNRFNASKRMLYLSH